MRSRVHRYATLASVLVMLGAFRSGAEAQDVAMAGRGPRFLTAASPSSPPTPLDLRTTPVLRKQITLRLDAATLPEALTAVTRASGLPFVYGVDILPAGVRVTVRADAMTVAAALTQVLIDTDLDVLLLSSGRTAALVRRADTPRRPGAPAGGVSGRVTDAKSGAPVVRAEVLLRGTRWQTVTDTAGRYRLAGVEAGSYTLVTRRIGYAKRERAITVAEGEDTVNVSLEPQAARLDELVTTATGRRRRIDVANDITTINADSVMKAAPIHSVTDLLENRVPGLTVQRTSGAPGDPARLRLRGASSPLQNNDPIVIVDGVRMYAKQSDPRSANLANGNFAAPSPLDYIDPNSIETMEIVKGPSAAALYGQDAANGVIVITTKKGRAGPTRWTMSATHGRSQMAEQYPDLFYRWGHRIADQVPVLCPINGFSTGSIHEPPCAGDSVLTFQMLNDPQLTVLGTGHATDLALGASGGTQALTYSITGSYRDQLGLVKLPDYEADRYQLIEGRSPPDWMRRPQNFRQWGVTARLDARLGATANVGLSTSLTRERQQRSSLEQQLGALMSTFLDRSSGLYYSSGSGDGAPSYSIVSYRQRVTDAATQFNNSLNADWHPRPWLLVNATAGLNYQQRADESLLPKSRDSLLKDGDNLTGTLSAGTGSVLTSTVNAGAIATAPLALGFTFRLASGINYVGTSSNDTKLGSPCLRYGSSDIIDCPGIGQKLSGSRVLVDDATFGWYLAPSVGNSKFNIEGGLRFDGGSSYGSGIKLPTFPRLGFSYLLSDEPFFPLKSLFQSFRVRAAYGRAGRQPGATDRLRLYSAIHPALDGDSVISDIVALQSLGNSQLRPERTTEFEGGFDADLFDSRLTLTLSGVRKTTNDALLPTTVPPSVNGGGTVLSNIGTIRNTVLELSADVQLLRSNVATVSTRFALTQNHSKVVRLGTGVQPFYSPANSDGMPGGTRIVPGYPLFGRWSRPVLGYADANGDGVLQASEVLLGDTLVYVGSPEPDYQLAVQPSVSLWHGALMVTAGISHIGGMTQRNEVVSRLTPFSRGASDPTAALGEQLASGLATGQIGSTDFNWIQTVATTRLDNLSVRYAVPANVARRLGAQNLGIAVRGSNLGLWTNYRGLDPNVNAFPTGNSVTDTGVLPQPRIWEVRLDATY